MQDQLEAAVNDALRPVIAEALVVVDGKPDILLGETGWAMLSLGWFAPAVRPLHERIDV